MEELQKEKEALDKKIVDLQSEIEMGKIFNDQEMINQAQAKIEDSSKQIEEINKKIDLELQKEEKISKLEEELPNQYIYHIIINLPEEKIKELADEQLKPNRDKKAELENRLKALLDNKREIEKRIEEIKTEFKNTHSPELLAEAKSVMEKYEAIKTEIQSTTVEMDEVGPIEVNPEDFRTEMISQLNGGYKKPGDKSTISYLKQELEKGKSNEEIVEELNNTKGNINGYSEDLSNPKIKVIQELLKNTTSEPGHLTVEDIENYLIEQEFISEQEEKAKNDSNVSGESLKPENEEELDQMLEKENLKPEETKQDGIAY